ncbi:hypothetical protein SUGI_0981430 [Cryptomeria japonica]|uniref:pentatricopeptide repeat-containing protein At2g13600 n=1 Tax=Cryptomeria japonica TaxID=3369 RepID=UPI0024146BCB|nr:pentatricopeptide repeat-containing protein At2g13600 [Cryptomeria japonica]GLJ46572.1 hypothetical protein SUGI_0981430 [Cryptomeria japonica]
MLKLKPVVYSTFLNTIKHHNACLKARSAFTTDDSTIVSTSGLVKVQHCCSNRYTFAALLRQCKHRKDVNHVHALVIKAGFGLNMSLLNELLRIYSKCESLMDTRQVFDKMPERNIVSWTLMISGCVDCANCEKAVEFFNEMQLTGIRPNSFTLCTILKICVVWPHLGYQVQAHAIKFGLESDIFIGSALVDMHAKFGRLEDANKAFQRSQRDAVAWNVMIARYVEKGYELQALKLFSQMQGRDIDIRGDQFTFATIIRACAHPEQCKQVHAQIVKMGFESDCYVRGSLVDTYARYGNLDAAHMLLDNHNVVAYNAMIAGYVQNGYSEKALELFQKMHRMGMNMEMDHFTFATVLSASSSLAVDYGIQIHARIIKSEFGLDDCVGNALIDMYSKRGSIDDAEKVFHRMRKTDLISWTALITGYTQNGCYEEALKQFCKMQRINMKPNEFTFSSVLTACANLASKGQGEQVCVHAVKTGYDKHVFVGSTLIDMYSKCGNMEKAQNVFDRMPELNVVSWTALIVGYAQNGYGRQALQFFARMQQSGMKPNHVTLVGVLFACSHVGLVDEGYRYFESMSRDYGIIPRVEHYACMADILSRAGHLKQAKNLIMEMPFQPCALLWRILLGACRVHGDIDLGKCAAEHILELEPQDGPAYVLLSNAYAAAGKWSEAAHMRKMMKSRALKKEPACSWIEIKNHVHVFGLGEGSNSHIKERYSKLDELLSQMQEVWPMRESTSFVLHDLEESQEFPFFS